MKTRTAFVANSSSSSFIIVSLGNDTILTDDYTEMETCGCASMDIDELIVKLQEAKAKGITKIEIEHGGGYDG